ncbi:MAG: ATP-binding protein [Myxococcales bacterium]
MVVQEVAEILAEKAQGKGVDLVYRVAPDVPRVVEADVDRVRQVLTNLVGNAVKFTDKGEVFVQLALEQPLEDGKTETVLRFEVRDSGIGIPENLREHVFESFSQADGSMVRQHGGTGLGLAISKQMVILMGGTIGLQSELGKGSTFWFTLPVKIVETSAAERALPPSIGKHALIVCDNEHAAASLREHVVAWGMSAVVVGDETSASMHLRKSMVDGPRFDLLLISETQSATHAAPLIASLRKTILSGLPPIVTLSQLRPDSTRLELDQEVAAQLAQPVRMSELYECLARVLLGTGGGAKPQSTNHLQAKSYDFRGAHVLVVDDNEMNQFVAAELLERFGCKVDQAFNGREAVDAVLKNRYALVLMDCQMPVMDGYTATAEIRAREPVGQRTAIVALTAHALEGERDRVLSAGMDDYLTKPVRPQTLQRALARWIQLEGLEVVGEPAVGEADNSNADAGTHDEQLESCATALLQMFLDKVPMQLELLDAALAGQDVQEVRAQAHKLKGSLLAVTANGLAELAHKLQIDGEHGDLSKSETTHGQLLEGFYRFEKLVKQELYQRTRAANRVSHGE